MRQSFNHTWMFVFLCLLFLRWTVWRKLYSAHRQTLTPPIWKSPYCWTTLAAHEVGISRYVFVSGWRAAPRSSPWSHPVFLPCRTDQLEDHAAAAAAALHLSDAGVSVPHSGPEGAAEAAGPTALQRDHRSPAHQGLPVWRQHHHQRVRCMRLFELSVNMAVFTPFVWVQIQVVPPPRPGAALPTRLILFWSTLCLHKAFLIRVQVFVPAAGKCFSAYTSGCAPKSMCTVHLVQHTKWNLMLTLSSIDSFWVNKTRYNTHKTCS